MKNIERLLVKIGDGSKLEIKLEPVADGMDFDGGVVDRMGYGYISAKEESLSELLSALDDEAGEWLEVNE